MSDDEHTISRKTVIYDTWEYVLNEDGELAYHGQTTHHVENFATRECSCGEAFLSDEKAIEHLRSVREGDEVGPSGGGQ